MKAVFLFQLSMNLLEKKTEGESLQFPGTSALRYDTAKTCDFS